MSLCSAGVTIDLVDVSRLKQIGRVNLGHGHSETNDAAEALRIAVEEFIKSEKFKDLTTTSCCKSMDLHVEFLVLTTMPR